MKNTAVFFAFLLVCILGLTVPVWAQPQVEQAQPAKAYFAAYRTPAHVKRSQAAVFVEVTDGLVEFLHSKNIALVKGPTTEVHIPVKTLLKKVRQAGAGSLIYVTVDRPISVWIKITVECFDDSGKLLWKEDSSDMWSMRGKGGTKKSLARMEAKLDKKLGGPGLPISATEARPSPVAAQSVKIATSQPRSPGRVWWVEAGAQEFVLKEHVKQPLATFEVGENARFLAKSPDGSLVAIASDGRVKVHRTFGGVLEHWPEGGSQSAVTLIKMPDYGVAGHYKVPFRPHFIAFGADGTRLVVVSLGQVSKNKHKQISPEITLLEIPGGKVLKQVELDSAPLEPWFIPQTHRLIVPCRGAANGEEAPPELVVLDTRQGSVHKVPLPSMPVAWHEGNTRDGRYLITRTGIVILTVAGDVVSKPVEAGEEITLFQPDPHAGRCFLAGKTNDQGRLIVLKNGQVVKSLETIPAEDLIIDEKQSRLILYGDKQGAILDSQTFAEQGRLPLPDHVIQARMGPEGSRLYVVDQGYHINVIDLATRQQVARITAGRGGAKFLRNVLVPSVMTFATVGSLAATGTPGIYPFIGSLPFAGRPVYCMAFSPKGHFVYVFNPRTNDITIVKSADNSVVRKVAVGPTMPDWMRERAIAEGSLWQTADGRYLVSCQLDKVVVFDTEKGAVAGEKDYKGAKPRYEPGLGFIFVQEADGTEVLRLASLAFVKDLKPAGKFVFKPKHEGIFSKGQGTFEPPEDLVFKPRARRFFLFSPAGVRIFDYDLNPVGQVVGISNSGGVEVLP